MPDAVNKKAAPLLPVEANPPTGEALAVTEHRLPSVKGDSPIFAETKMGTVPLPASRNQEKPLVPVPKVIAAERPVGTVEGTAVRRLPPVDPNVPPVARYPSESAGGAIPIYPSTGIK